MSVRSLISDLRFETLLALIVASSVASACPFCTSLKPTLSQRREEAAVAAIAECLESSPKQATFRIHQAIKGKEQLAASERRQIPLDVQIKPGTLAVLFAGGTEKDLTWSVQPASELALSYFAKAPSLRTPAAERLRYFTRFLEHDDPLLAQDAFDELGHAPYDVVEEVAKDLPVDQLRQWLSDPNIRPERKGFYGLALGLAGRTQGRDSQEAFLRQLILTPADDFRAGFDGLLGGFLVLAGEPGLELIERQFLANRQARVGDVRHAMSALRFYHEFGREIPKPRLARALRHLLARPEFIAAAVTDLTRWQDWDSASPIIELAKGDPLALPRDARLAMAIFLTLCPGDRCAAELKRLAKVDPDTVLAAEKASTSTRD